MRKSLHTVKTNIKSHYRTKMSLATWKLFSSIAAWTKILLLVGTKSENSFHSSKSNWQSGWQRLCSATTAVRSNLMFRLKFCPQGNTVWFINIALENLIMYLGYCFTSIRVGDHYVTHMRSKKSILGWALGKLWGGMRLFLNERP